MNQEELRERFNPDGSLLRCQQMRMLDILVEVDRICQRHDILYWLSSGTLIGAMRHDGFIPWDDDLDIEMMRDDYLRLMEVLPGELPDWLALQNDETDEHYFYFYAKVRDRRSRMVEQNGYDRMWKEQGIYIDILPMEQHPIWLQKLSEKTVGHMYKIWRTSQDDAKAIKRVRRIFDLNNKVIFPFFRTVLFPLFSCLLPRKVITSGLGIPFHKPRYRDEIFPLATHEFEGLRFPVPGKADAHLRHLFGDYMQLPDLNKPFSYQEAVKIPEHTQEEDEQILLSNISNVTFKPFYDDDKIDSERQGREKERPSRINQILSARANDDAKKLLEIIDFL